jgi:hypothetical protein
VSAVFAFKLGAFAWLLIAIIYAARNDVDHLMSALSLSLEFYFVALFVRKD